MAQSYFKDFWIISEKGEKLFPAAIRNRDTGLVSFRILAKGDNKKSAGREVVDPIDAIRQFLSFNSMRFGTSGRPDNRFTRGSDHVVKIDAAPTFRASNPTLSW